MKKHRLLLALKNVLRSKGIAYAELAKKLSLNETSVKRMMSGHTAITLDRMDEICEIINVDIFELLKLNMQSRDTGPIYLSLEQEHALAEEVDLFLCFYGLAKGLSVDEIVSKYNITQNRAQKALFRLAKIFLLEVLPANKVKFLVPRSVRWRENGPLSKKYQKDMEEDFLNNSFSQGYEVKKFLTFPLSERSKVQFNRRFKELVSELQSQSEIDLTMDKGLKSTATLLVGFREWTPSLLRKHLR